MRKFLLTLSCVVVLTIMTTPVFAAPTDNDPKPLTAAPADKPLTADKPKEDPYAFPKAFTDMRREMKNEFNAWLKDDEALQAACAAVHTPAERTACDRKKEYSQNRLEAIHQRTRTMQHKIDAWRREAAGLPPLPAESQSGAQANSAPPPNAPPKTSPVLLPDSAKPLPANTF